MSFCIVYLASPRGRRIGCCDFSRKFDILKSSLAISTRLFPKTDIYIFHEDFETEDFKALPDIKEYIKVDFSGYDDVFVKHVFPKGYMLMCRFFSGVLQKYPQLSNYTHYMRLDDDSYFMEPNISEEHVQKMLKYDYVYRSLYHDLKYHQELFDFTVGYLKSAGYPVQLLYPELVKSGVLDGNNKYTGLAPYNNFHLSSISLWNHPVVKSYIDKIESDSNILKKGWLDSNIHGMIIFLITPFIGKMVHHDGTFGYRHNKHVSIQNATWIQWRDDLPFHP